MSEEITKNEEATVTDSKEEVAEVVQENQETEEKETKESTPGSQEQQEENKEQSEQENQEEKSDENKSVIKVEVRNTVTIIGNIDSDVELSHKVHDEGIYRFTLKVPRIRDGVFDYLIVELPERGNDINSYHNGDRVKIIGQLRSVNRKSQDGKSYHLYLSIFVDEIEHDDSTRKVNEIKLIGNVCKKPNKRLTSKGKDICDMILAVNRNYGKSDYIPCITWGRDAKYASEFNAGERFYVVGRVQSRVYKKKLSETEIVEKTTYEVSVSDIRKLKEDDTVMEDKVVSTGR